VQLITSPLIMDDWYPRIDFDDFASKVSDPKVRLFFLCHPHNPTGRVWLGDELMKLGSGLTDHSQKSTVAASARAEK